MSEDLTLAGPSEPGPNVVDPSEAGLSGINYYTLYIIKFDFFCLDHTYDLFIIVSNQSISMVRRGQGPSKNLALKCWRCEHPGQHLQIEISAGYTGPIKGWCEPWQIELGIICHSYALVVLFDWHHVVPAQRKIFYTYLQVK